MEENELFRFAEQLLTLNKQLAEVFNTGRIALFTEINRTIKEMYRLQHGKQGDVFLAINPDCESIYKNFNMIIAVLRTTEDGVIDHGAQSAINKFLHNIHDATVNIASIFGMI